MIAFLADLHIGNHARFPGVVEGGVNGRCRELLECLHAAARVVSTNRARALIVAGDIFDNDKPSPPVLAAAMSVFSTITEHTPVYVLVGNHDQHSSDKGDNALATLRHLTGVAVIDTPTFVPYLNAMLVPFHPKQVGGVAAYLREVLVRSQDVESDVPLLAVGHFGIINKGTPWYLANSSNAIGDKDLAAVCEEYGYASVVAGDWHMPHDPRDPEMVGYQIGCLAPINFTDGEYSGGVLLWHEGAHNKWMERVEIAGPRFITVRDADDLFERPDCTHPYVRVLAESVVAQGLAAAARKLWPSATVVVEPADTDMEVTADDMTRHWTSDAVLEATVDYAEHAVPAPMREEVVHLTMKHIEAAR